jgi:indolepyruvate decarboxylase
MLRAFQPESRFNDLDDWNFAAIAPSLGGYGERVRTRRELNEAIECAVWRRRQSTLIEVMLLREAISKTLARFVLGIQGCEGASASARQVASVPPGGEVGRVAPRPPNH